MKQLLLLCLITGTILTSCSKKGIDAPTPPTNPITPTVITLPDSVTIGTQTWTSVNYSGPGGVNYKNTDATNPNWGKLYTNAEVAAMVLPKRWRIPTTADYNKLMQFVGATAKDDQGNYLAGSSDAAKLMSKTTWLVNVGTNSTGFNAFPAGYMGDGGGPAFYYASGYSTNYLTAAFATSSTFTGAGAGMANFAITQNTLNATPFTGGVITTYSPTGGVAASRTSIRFVRDN